MSNLSAPGLLSELPAGWSWQSLGGVLKVRNGFAFRSSDYQESGVLLIRQSNLGGNRVSLDKAEYLPEDFLKDHKDFRVRKGDVLIGMSGSIGKLCVYDRDESALQNQRTGLLQFKDDSLRSWIWHYLPLIENKLHEGSKGIGVQNISASQIEALPIPVAPKEHRVRIVSEIEKQFSRLDEAVANLKRAKANLKRYKASVLKAAVEGKLTEDFRKQHPNVEPASKLLERILAERRSKWKGRGKYKEPIAPDTNDLPSLPKGWTWATVGQLGAPEPNSITDGPFGSNLKTEHYKETGPRVIRLQNIGDGVFVNEEAHISEEHFARLQKHRIFADDLVIAALGVDPPRSCLIPQSVSHAIVKADCVRFKPHRDAVARYLNVALNSEPTRQRAKSIVHGVGRPRLNLGEIKTIVVSVPPTIEQQAIVAEVERRLSVIEELNATVEANLIRADRLRQSILRQAFSGKLLFNGARG